MRSTYARLKRHGVEWVAIHPYARIREDGTVSWRREQDGARPANWPAHWTVPIRVAKEVGLKILIKPHLAYWGSSFRWRGAIEFREEEQWQRFFRGLSDWTVELAKACRDADGFCVGCELDRTIGYEKEWRALIRRVRKETRAALTYAANWDSYARVGFWDELDVIGIQAYFPLTTVADPTRRELNTAWKERMVALRQAARKWRRNIVFTELGYNRSKAAAREPWAHATDGPETEVLQALCLGAALDAIDSEDSVLGCFLWKWFPGRNAVGRNFQLATPRLLGEIEKRWRRAGR